MATTITIKDDQGNEYIFLPSDKLVLGGINLQGSEYRVQGLTSIKVPFAFDNTTPTSTVAIPDTYDVYMIRMSIETAFDGTTPTVSVATNGTSPKTLVATTDFDVTQVEQYGKDDIIALGTNEGGNIAVTVTPDGSTAGAGFVDVFYMQPSS